VRKSASEAVVVRRRCIFMVGCVRLVGKRRTAHDDMRFGERGDCASVQMPEAPSRLRWKRSSVVLFQDGPVASCDRNFLAGQGLVHSNRKIASQLSPVLMAIRPSSKLKGQR